MKYMNVLKFFSVLIIMLSAVIVPVSAVSDQQLNDYITQGYNCIDVLVDSCVDVPEGIKITRFGWNPYILTNECREDPQHGWKDYELSCQGNNKYKACSKICNPKVKPTSTTPKKEKYTNCNDPDGNNPNVKTWADGYNIWNEGKLSWGDYCTATPLGAQQNQGGYYQHEAICQQTENGVEVRYAEPIKCEFGCGDGVCLSTTETPISIQPTETIYLTGSNNEPGFANMDWNDISGLGTKFDKYNVKWQKGYYLDSGHADSWISFGSYYNLGNLEEGPWTFQVCLSDNKNVFEETCSNVVTVDVTPYPVEYIEETIINEPIENSNYVVWTRSKDETSRSIVAKYVKEGNSWNLKEKTKSILRDAITVTPTSSYPDQSYRADVILNNGEVATFVAFYPESNIPSTLDIDNLNDAKGYVMIFQGDLQNDGKVHACSWEKGCQEDYSSHAEEMVFYENGKLLTIYEKENNFLSGAVVTELVHEELPEVEYATYPETMYACDSGCFYNEKCLPIGTRLRNGETKYCGWDGTMTPQQDIGTSCQNNYECSTNTCLSGACTDLEHQLNEQKNLLERILQWFERFF